MVYSAGNLLVKLIGFILLPIYIKKLSLVEFGYLAIFEVTINILTPVFSMNIGSTFKRFLPDIKDERQRGILLFTVLAFILFSGVLANIILQPFSSYLAHLILDKHAPAIYFHYLFAIIFAQIFLSTLLNYYNAEQKSITYSLIYILKFVLILGFVIIYLVIKNQGLLAVLKAYLFSNLLLVIFFGIPYVRQLYFKFDKKLFVELMRYSWPMAFSGVANNILGFGDRYVLKFILGAAAVGIYSLAARFANLIDLVMIYSFSLAYEPYALRSYKDPGFANFHKKMLTLILLVSLYLALILSLFSEEVVMIFAPTKKSYWQAIPFIAPLAFAKSLGIMKNIFSISLYIKKRTKPFGLIITLAAVLNILFNIVLVYLFGIYGAIIATLLVVVFMDVAFYLYAQNTYRFEYEFNRVWVAILVTIGFWLLTLPIMHLPYLIKLGLKIILVIAYPALFFIIGYFKPSEIEIIKGFFYKWRNPKNWASNLKDWVSK